MVHDSGSRINLRFQVPVTVLVTTNFSIDLSMVEKAAPPPAAPYHRAEVLVRVYCLMCPWRVEIQPST